MTKNVSGIVKWLIAFVLLLAVLAGSVYAIFYSVSALDDGAAEPFENKSTLTANGDEEDGTEATVQGNGMKLTSTTVSAAEATAIDATADGITLVTATIEPSNAMDTTVLWTVSGTYASMIKIMDGDTGTTEVTQTQSGESVYVVCYGAFSEQVIIRATSKKDSSIYTEIACDYVARLNSDAGYSITICEETYDDVAFSFKDTDDLITWKVPEGYSVQNDMSYTYLANGYNGSALVGTIFDTYTVREISAGISSYSFAYYSNGAEFEQKYDYCIMEYYNGESTYFGIEYWIDDFFDLYDMDAEKYEYYQGLYESGLPFGSVQVTLVGDTYGLEYTFTFDVLVDISNYYVAANAVSANAYSIAF